MTRKEREITREKAIKDIHEQGEKIACIDCYHCMDIKENGMRLPYSQICLASPLPKKFSYLTGTERVRGLGYALCKDINDGNCPLWKAK